MARKNVNITLDPEVYEVIKDMAEKDQRTVSSMIGLILKRYMREHPTTPLYTQYWQYPQDPQGYPQYTTATERSAAAETME